MTKWPSEKELQEVLKELEKVPGARMLPPDATPVDRLKHHICKQFVIYFNKTKISQRELAKKVGIDEALMSKILHYHFDEFTTDRLIRILANLYPKVNIKIDVG